MERDGHQPHDGTSSFQVHLSHQDEVCLDIVLGVVLAITAAVGLYSCWRKSRRQRAAANRLHPVDAQAVAAAAPAPVQD